MYHVLVCKALKRAEHSSQESDGSCKAEMFLVPVSLKGTEPVFLWKNRKTWLKRCDHSKVLQPERNFQLEIRSVIVLLSFDVEKGWGRSRYRIYGRFNEACNVERRGDMYLSPAMEPAKFIQVSCALSVVKRSEPTFPH